MTDDEYTSKQQNINKGVLHGLILGPPLFLIFINDHSDNINITKLSAYGQEPQLFEIRSEVHQGCVLSLTLFNYTID